MPEEDAEVLARARAGDPAALEVLVARHLSDVYDVAARVLGDRDLARDAAQDAFVNALGALDRFRGDASFRTWLLRIAVNAARSLARREARRREVSLLAVDGLPDGGPDPAAQTSLRAEAGRVEAVLARLPEKQRLAVTLRVYQGLSFRDVGEAIGCSEGAARVNYHHGIKRLRELLR
ncbi:MAG: RNA polymerase sigma factor [Gemmatimonadetes bacterium]|nr:RNA polymerase sigma factor [Gemmatimonadota bacterium]